MLLNGSTAFACENEIVPSARPGTAAAPNSACVSHSSERRPPGFVTPMTAPFGSDDRLSRSMLPTVLPSADSLARSSRVPPVHTPSTKEPPANAVVMSAETSPMAVLPTSAAAARAFFTMASTSAAFG